MKENLRRKFKKENGAVSVLVAITVLAFVTILLGAIMIITITRQTQLESDIRIQEIYGRDVERVDEVYNEVYTGASDIKISGNTQITVGDTSQLKATLEPANTTYKNVTWSSSNTNVATISNDGIVTSLQAGTTTITATLQDGFNTQKSVDVTVSKNSSVKILVIYDQPMALWGGSNLNTNLNLCFENVTYNPDITDEELLNSNYDLYISNGYVWSTGRGEIISQLFSRGKNILTTGNNNNADVGLSIIKSWIMYLNTNERNGRKIINNQVSKDFPNTYTTADDANAVEFVDGVETWYVEEKNGTEYSTVVSLNGNSGNMWFHDQIGTLFNITNAMQLRDIVYYVTGND